MPSLTTPFVLLALAAGGFPPEAANPAPPVAAPSAAPLRLTPPGSSDAGRLSDPNGTENSRPRSGVASAVTVASSLVVVLGLFLIVAWAMRRGMPIGSAPLPREVVDVLGRSMLAGRQQVHLIRCGQKLLLVSVTAGGAETLTEIVDPAEVDRLAGLCHQARPGSATASFRNILGQFNQGRAGDTLETVREA